MSVTENYNKNIPEYYDTMYLDGYTPQEIYNAHKKRMIDKVNEKKEESPTVEIVSEINKKWKPIVKIKRRKRKNLF